MSKEIVINIGTRETRMALIDGGKLVELHVERDERVAGSVYKCRVANVLPGMDAAFVDIGLERNAFLYAGDVLPEAGEEFPAAKKEAQRANIKDLLKVGQELVVQVVKAPRGTKGARVSTRISLPGRYLVLMPEADNIGISRKIEDTAERDRLKKIAEKIKPANCGMIVRTEAEGRGERDLRADVDFLMRMLTQIQERAKVTPAPGLIHQDLSLVFKTIRDVFGSNIQKMFIDSPVEYQKALEVVELISPKLKSRLVLYDDPEPIFEHFSIENEIDRLLKRKVWLKSGGHITIDQTEALTTIDVNTGKFIGSTSLSDTILKTNLDAATEIARQLRLRDIGGIIIIDFIDMSSARDRSHVVNALERALKKDRTRTKISNISPLGLIEMTRKRTGETISELISEACPYCQGRGHILSPESVSINIERELMQKANLVDDEAFLITTNQEVAEYLIGPRGETVNQIEQQIRRAVYVRGIHDQHIEDYDIQPGDLMEIESQMLSFRRSQIVECEVVRNPFVSLPRAAAWAEGGYMIDLANGGKYIGQRVKARLSGIMRSYAEGEVLSVVKGERTTPVPLRTEPAGIAPNGERESRRKPEREPRPKPEPQPRVEIVPQQSKPEREPEPAAEREPPPKPERESRPRSERASRQRSERASQPKPEPELPPKVEEEPQPAVAAEQEAQPQAERPSRSRSRRPSSRRGRGSRTAEEREAQPAETPEPEPVAVAVAEPEPEPQPQPVEGQEPQPAETPTRRPRSRSRRSRSRGSRSPQNGNGEQPQSNGGDEPSPNGNGDAE